MVVFAWVDERLEGIECAALKPHVGFIARLVGKLTPEQKARIFHVDDADAEWGEGEQEREFVYIGRGQGKWKPVGFGNPESLFKHKQNRRACLRAYVEGLVQNERVMRQLRTLRNKNLVCHCRKRNTAAHDELCHGLVLVALVDYLFPQE